jgi:hypothetical protein
MWSNVYYGPTIVSGQAMLADEEQVCLRNLYGFLYTYGLPGIKRACTTR